jgi:DnaJ-class molecular chaperone
MLTGSTMSESFCPDCGYDFVVCQCGEDEDEDCCLRCHGRGTIPSPDYLAIEGVMEVDCPECFGPGVIIG